MTVMNARTESTMTITAAKALKSPVNTVMKTALRTVPMRVASEMLIILKIQATGKKEQTVMKADSATRSFTNRLIAKHTFGVIKTVIVNTRIELIPTLEITGNNINY